MITIQSKKIESQIILKFLEARKPKDLNRIKSAKVIFA
jgi:hypothetical protein